MSVPVSQPINAASQSGNLHNQVLNEVNRYRLTKGATALNRHRGLDQLAQNHAEYLVKNKGTFSLHGKTVSHYGFSGRALIARERLGMENMSENVASTTGGPRGAPQVIYNLWVNSKGHEHNMRAAWSHTGVGVAIANDGTVIAVQLFGTSGRMRSHDQMMDKFRSF